MVAPPIQRYFRLPDLTTSLPSRGFEFEPSARAGADTLLTEPPDVIFRTLLRDQESQDGLLVCRRILHAFLGTVDDTDPTEDAFDAADLSVVDRLADHVLTVRAELIGQLRRLDQGAATRDALLRHRARLSLMGSCWLDTVSQPATQPSVIVNRLYDHHFRLQGEGNPHSGVHHLRRRALESRGILLPELDATDFSRQVDDPPLTVWHALFHLALSRLPASFLPEVVAVHHVVNAVGIDDHLLGLTPILDEPELRATLTRYYSMTGESPTGMADRRRLRAAIGLALRLEQENVASAVELAARRANESLDVKVAAIIRRHAPFAGAQHQDVRVGGRLLVETFGDPDFDAVAFVRLLRGRREGHGTSKDVDRFLRAIRFGGPMFGVFDEREAATFNAWANAAAVDALPDVPAPPAPASDERAATWAALVRRSDPPDVIYRAARPTDHRRLFHRLVNIEAFPNTLALARRRVTDMLDRGEILFPYGHRGRYTDASYFDYTPEALFERVDRIYHEKLLGPYRPLTEIPGSDDVVAGQRSSALGSLIDGSWAHRVGNLGRYRRACDGLLFAVYADEMGRGDIEKNHITLIHRVLDSLRIRLPHIRDEEFQDEDQLPQDIYDFATYQLSLGLFPDTCYSEILGYNLGSEMFGLGEIRLQEIQKLRAHGFDTIYEEVHLAIDNVSAGHARQSAELIVAYLDDVARSVGPGAVAVEWRRVWRGYASFAYYCEPELLQDLTEASDALA